MTRLFALALFAVCGAGNMAAAQGWEIRYSQGAVLKPAAPGQAFSFDFPLIPGSVHYVTKPATAVAKRAASASFTVTTQDQPMFDYRTEPANTCVRPAAVRLFLQRWGDDMSGDGAFEFYRWWSNSGVVLQDGTFTLTVPLDPALWTSVLGRTGDKNPAAFAEATANLAHVGVTFGGGCFYGHGVRITNGRATFTMNRFAVE